MTNTFNRESGEVTVFAKIIKIKATMNEKGDEIIRYDLMAVTEQLPKELQSKLGVAESYLISEDIKGSSHLIAVNFITCNDGGGGYDYKKADPTLLSIWDVVKVRGKVRWSEKLSEHFIYVDYIGKTRKGSKSLHSLRAPIPWRQESKGIRVARIEQERAKAAQRREQAKDGSLPISTELTDDIMSEII
jgi:hypothetical protein